MTWLRMWVSPRGLLSGHCAAPTGRGTTENPPRSAAARGLDRLRQDLQRLHRIAPAQAGIGDALAVLQRGGIVLARGELLRARLDMALDHYAENRLRAARDLRAHVAGHIDLLFVLLAAVGVAEVDHETRRLLGCFEVLHGGGHAGGVVVGRLATAQDHVAVLVAL